MAILEQDLFVKKAPAKSDERVQSRVSLQVSGKPLTSRQKTVLTWSRAMRILLKTTPSPCNTITTTTALFVRACGAGNHPDDRDCRRESSITAGEQYSGLVLYNCEEDPGGGGRIDGSADGSASYSGDLECFSGVPGMIWSIQGGGCVHMDHEAMDDCGRPIGCYNDRLVFVYGPM